MLKIEIIRFEAQDVITTSIAVNPGNDDNGVAPNCGGKCWKRNTKMRSADMFYHDTSVCECEYDADGCGCPKPNY